MPHYFEIRQSIIIVSSHGEGLQHSSHIHDGSILAHHFLGVIPVWVCDSFQHGGLAAWGPSVAHRCAVKHRHYDGSLWQGMEVVLCSNQYSVSWHNTKVRVTAYLLTIYVHGLLTCHRLNFSKKILPTLLFTKNAEQRSFPRVYYMFCFNHQHTVTIIVVLDFMPKCFYNA